MNKSITIVGITVTLALATGMLNRWLEQPNSENPAQAGNTEVFTAIETKPEKMNFEEVKMIIAQPVITPLSTQLGIQKLTEPSGQAQTVLSDPYAVGPIEEPEFSLNNSTLEDAQQDQTLHEGLKQLETWEQRYSSDTSGGQWSTLESRFEEIYSENELFDTMVTYANCRKHWCKVEAYHLGRGEEEAFIAAFALQKEVHIGNETALYHRHEDDQGGIRSLYFWSNTSH